MINWALVLTLLVCSNVMLTNGFAALSLQRSKNNILFTVVNCLFMAVTIISCSVIYRLIYGVLETFNMQNLGLLIIVALSGAFGFIGLQLIKLCSKEMYYYYDTTYSFVVNLGTSIGILISLNYTQPLLLTLFEGCMAAVAYIVVSGLFSLNYNRLANKRISRNVRPVPITIITIAILAMIIYAISICV